MSVEEDSRQEWTFTLYDFDNNGKVTREVSAPAWPLATGRALGHRDIGRVPAYCYPSPSAAFGPVPEGELYQERCRVGVVETGSWEFQGEPEGCPRAAWQWER